MTGIEAARRVDRLVRNGWKIEDVAAALCLSVYAIQKWKYGNGDRPVSPRGPVADALRRLWPKGGRKS